MILLLFILSYILVCSYMDYDNIVIHFHTENENNTAAREITNRQSYCVSDGDCGMIPYCSDNDCECKAGICNPVRKKPVNGGFSSWSTWSSCDSRARTQERDRICNNPPPQHGGLSCEGRSDQEQACSGKNTKLFIAKEIVIQIAQVQV